MSFLTLVSPQNSFSKIVAGGGVFSPRAEAEAVDKEEEEEEIGVWTGFVASAPRLPSVLSTISVEAVLAATGYETGEEEEDEDGLAVELSGLTSADSDFFDLSDLVRVCVLIISSSLSQTSDRPNRSITGSTPPPPPPPPPPMDCSCSS